MTSRRSFLSGGFGLAGAASAGPAAAAGAAPGAASLRAPADGHTPRWGMVMDLRKCIGCQACTVACAMENNLPEGQHRTYVPVYEVDGPHGPVPAMLPRICNHCETPPCVPVCPAGATYKAEDGIVLVDYDACVGCGYCVQACPYEARFLNKKTGTADKCTFCVQRLEAGLLPACVETCVGGARVFGDLDDPQSAAAKLIAAHDTRRLKPEAGTGPQVFYIGLDDRLLEEVEIGAGARALRLANAAQPQPEEA
ncbi:sulfate reduction electron transfer complex DsrMKJOP subunit DsrO [Maritimibacter sp. HL-12]|uniref:sulfate reduction electron transfer complex DsrMKJOP subunit DsrO n=1 Tax=Maritimibacter sp. HL-12 TaxID=1162418 RepID=UPI000A0F0C1B|nr:4Fe-4S dicluster domain-containing protein [Maritimibacter sp. HL-12]SMH31676.1 tetrathionate reductase beta subunit [Maritimibacter sp. HL-12]